MFGEKNMNREKRCEHCKYFDPKKRKITNGLIFGYGIECSDHGYCLNRDNINKYGGKNRSKRSSCSRFELCEECKEIDMMKKHEREEKTRKKDKYLSKRYQKESEEEYLDSANRRNSSYFDFDESEEDKVYEDYEQELSKLKETNLEENVKLPIGRMNKIQKEINLDEINPKILKNVNKVELNKKKKIATSKLIAMMFIVFGIIGLLVVASTIYLLNKEPEESIPDKSKLYDIVEKEFEKEENAHFEKSPEFSNPSYYYDLEFYNATNPFVICKGEVVVGGILFEEDERVHENYLFNYKIYLEDVNFNNLVPDCEYTLYDINGNIINKFDVIMELVPHKRGGVILVDYSLDNQSGKPVDYDYVYDYSHYEIRIDDFLNRSLDSINSVLRSVDEVLALY